MLSKIRTAGKCTYSTICMYMCLSLIFVRALYVRTCVYVQLLMVSGRGLQAVQGAHHLISESYTYIYIHITCSTRQKNVSEVAHRVE